MKILNQKTYAISGAGGYLGAHLSTFLREKGCLVVELHRYDSGQPIYHTEERVPFNLIQGQIGRRWDGIDVLVHCAYDFSCQQTSKCEETNLKGSAKLFQNAFDQGVKKIIHISSMSAYTDCKSEYGRMKLLIEKAGEAFNVVSLRPGLIYGGKNRGMFGKLQRIVALSPVIPYIMSEGRLSLVHIDDLCQTIFRVSEELLPASESYAVAHPDNYSMKQILQAIAVKAGLKRVFLPVAWQIAYFGFVFLDKIFAGKIPLSKDNLLGLVYSDKKPNYLPNAGSQFRAYID